MPVAPDLSAKPTRERSPAAVVAGSLMILAGLMLANPQGASDTRWPWQILSHWPWERPDFNWAVWYLTAILAIALGLRGTRNPRAPLLGGLAVLLLMTCGSGQAGLRLISEPYGWYLGVGVLAAGFLLESEGRWTTVARGACVLGGLILLTIVALSFGPSPSGDLESHLQQVTRDLVARALGQAIPDAEPGYEIRVLAKAAALPAALMGLGRGIGLRGGLVARIGLLLLLLHFLIPTFHKLGIQMGGPVQASAVFTTLSEVLIHSGLALSVLLAAAGADLGRCARRDA